MNELPIIDVAPLLRSDPKAKEAVAAQLFAACTDKGFFYIVGHGIDAKLEKKLAELSQIFFAQPEAEKMRICMENGGRAWRGYFPVGGELTSGKPDWKEGLYFGEEHAPHHPLVQAQTPLHGANLFPDIHGFRETVLLYLDAMRHLGDKLMEGLALSLGLPESYFKDHFTTEPTQLFRIFHYPPPPEGRDVWGVGEHTDYGLLTVLKQDDVGGLEVKSRDGWTMAPPLQGSYVCNIGDMLDRLTQGLYCSTPHRVMNRTQKERYSFPYFFDPGFAARIESLPIPERLMQKSRRTTAEQRWDKMDVHAAAGTYGDYLLAKIGKVFPDLKAKV
ncbi:MAG: isopenicillin N synthase family oxygenase [Proteobacteria bacterium]|nr:MAG: isopenicillin N synthase family oxygenase [Pseudomonadota bacterium]